VGSQPAASTARPRSAGQRARLGPGQDSRTLKLLIRITQSNRQPCAIALLVAAITEARQPAQARRLQSPGRRDSDSSVIAQWDEADHRTRQAAEGQSMISSLTEPRAARLGSGGTARALSKCPGKSSDHPMIGRLIPGPTGWDRPFVKSEKGAEVQPVIQGPDNNLSFWQEWQDFRLEFPSPTHPPRRHSGETRLALKWLSLEFIACPKGLARILNHLLRAVVPLVGIRRAQPTQYWTGPGPGPSGVPPRSSRCGAPVRGKTSP
jgi:hypothetical protein